MLKRCSILSDIPVFHYHDRERLLARPFDPRRITPAADTETCPAPRRLTHLSKGDVRVITNYSAAAVAVLAIGLVATAAPASPPLLPYRPDLPPATPAVNSQISGTATFVLNTVAN